MELRDYLRILWGRRWLIALCTALAAGTALGFSARITPTYDATAKVFVGPRSVEKNDAAGVLQELTASQQYVTSYAEILKSRPLAEIVVQKTGAPITPSELSEKTDTKILPDTRLIEVTVTDTNASRAQTYVNQMVDSFVADDGNLFGGGGAITASVFEPALKPVDPVSPKPMQNGVIGGLLGLMLGVGIAFVLEQLDTTLRNKEDVEKILAPVPVIATIPLSPTSKERPLFMESDANSPQAEAIRILRTNIQFFSVDRPVNRVLVTSPFAGDGKTTVASNLAVGMAAVGSSVLLIETDLRKPVLNKMFGGPQSPGLSDVLSGQSTLSDAIRRTRIPNLSIIVAGPTPPNPSEILGSERMADLINTVSTMVDIIILDTPPALPVTDAAVLAPHTDGVILVVRAGQTHAHKALDVIKNFERHDVRVLGVAINGVDRETDGGYYYRYSYSGDDEKGGSGRKRNRGDAEFDDLAAPTVRPAHRPAPPKAKAPSEPGSNGAPGPAFRPDRARPGVKPPSRRTGRNADEARNAAFRAKLRSSLGENSDEDEYR
ncbi:polysaccharide biosynthesis tyrosine autokinase [soil metagenome]